MMYHFKIGKIGTFYFFFFFFFFFLLLLRNYNDNRVYIFTFLKKTGIHSLSRLSLSYKHDLSKWLKRFLENPALLPFLTPLHTMHTHVHILKKRKIKIFLFIQVCINQKNQNVLIISNFIYLYLQIYKMLVLAKLFLNILKNFRISTHYSCPLLCFEVIFLVSFFNFNLLKLLQKIIKL